MVFTLGELLVGKTRTLSKGRRRTRDARMDRAGSSRDCACDWRDRGASDKCEFCGQRNRFKDHYSSQLELLILVRERNNLRTRHRRYGHALDEGPIEGKPLRRRVTT